MDEESIWCPEVLSDDAHETISKLSKLPALGAFYLAGGTALALRYVSVITSHGTEEQ